MQYTISEFGFRMAHENTLSPDARTFTRHAHPEYELLYFLSGEADCVVDHMRHALSPGELALIPPLSYHFISVTGGEPYERIVIDFADCGLPGEVLSRVFAEPRIIDTAAAAEIRELFARMDAYANRFSGEPRTLLARNLTAELICLLDTAKEPATSAFSGFSRVLEDAMRYIDEHIDSIAGIDELCAHLYVSRAYLHRLFRNSMGISPMRYITDKRLLLAQSRLRLGEKPTQVCAVCGFGDYSAFYRAYRAYFGISPAEELTKRKNAPD